jgi:hypothetical protein
MTSQHVSGRKRRKRIQIVRAVTFGVPLVLTLFFGTPSGAVPACEFNAGTRIVTVELSPGDSATLSALDPGPGSAQILLNGITCVDGVTIADVDNTDTINVEEVTPGSGTLNASAESLTIDLSTGEFTRDGAGEGGAGAIDEIEMTVNLGTNAPTTPEPTDSLLIVGTPGADTITRGQGGIELNGDIDLPTANDIEYNASIESFTLEGAGGARHR